MPERDRERVIGIVVNRFRGDRTLFDDGIGILEQICRVPVLAVIPYFDHGLDEEDRPLRLGINEAPQPGKLHVGAVLYPRVSNTEDLSPLLVEPDLQVTWITDPRLIEQQDLIVLPGTKATLGDLTHITATGVAEAVTNVVAKGAWVLGLCGGYVGCRLRQSSIGNVQLCCGLVDNCLERTRINLEKKVSGLYQRAFLIVLRH